MMVTRAYLYIVKASPEPGSLTCGVPFRIDDLQIFFGPCKKNLRARLRKEYLSPTCAYREVQDPVYLVGFNGANRQKVRVVQWAGRVSHAMTFAEAHARLTGPRYADLRAGRYQAHRTGPSPLHLRPIRDGGTLRGYERTSCYHEKDDAWVADLVSPQKTARHRVTAGRRIEVVPPFTAWEAFPRDCCILLENLFFTSGRGIAVDDECLAVLRQAKQIRSPPDAYAVFGHNRIGSAEGLTGRTLDLTGEPATRFIGWVNRRAAEIREQPATRAGQAGEAGPGCGTSRHGQGGGPTGCSGPAQPRSRRGPC